MRTKKQIVLIQIPSRTPEKEEDDDGVIFHNQLGYEMVVSLEDLLGRLAVASDRKVCKYCETPDQAIFMLGLPYPAEATNEQLNIRLQPLYVELLQSISGTSTTRNFDRLDESEEQALLFCCTCAL